MNRFNYLLSLLALVLLAACQGQPGSVALQTQAHSWIDAPLDGSHLPLGPVAIVAHASDLSPIVSMELSVNGSVIATLPNTNSGRLLAEAQQTWTPLAPGNYAIRVRAMNSSSVWGDYAESDVTIGNAPPVSPPTAVPSPAVTTASAASPTGPATLGPPPINPPVPLAATPRTNAPKPTATHTRTPQPTKTPTVVASKPTLTDHSVSASLFYWGAGKCTPKYVTIEAVGSDPTGISSIHVRFRLATQSSYTDDAMSRSDSTWILTLQSENDIPGYSTVTGPGSVALQFYFILTNTGGQQTQSQSFNNSTALEYCPAIK